MAASAVAGVPFGIVWWWLAPLSPVEKRADGVYRAGGEADEAAVAADGWFAVLALGVGIAVALVVYLRTRPGRVGPLLSLVTGGLLGSLVAWQVGHLLGPEALEATARGLEVGARFSAPLDLSAYAVLLGWPIGAVITYFAVSAGADAGEHAEDHDAEDHDIEDHDAEDHDIEDPDGGATGEVRPGAGEPSAPH